MLNEDEKRRLKEKVERQRLASTTQKQLRVDALYQRSSAEALTCHEVHRLCCTVVGMDRNEWARETALYQVRLVTIPGLWMVAKSDLLIGWPSVVARSNILRARVGAGGSGPMGP